MFGFASGGVYVKSGRRSASRFFWSRPVVLEFERQRPGYGSAGLLADLERERPAVVALQKQDWGLAEDVKNSMDFFMTTPPASPLARVRLRARLRGRVVLRLAAKRLKMSRRRFLTPRGR